MQNRLPINLGDDSQWGTILNRYLLVAHNQFGSFKTWINSTRPINPDDFTIGINEETKVIERYNETTGLWTTVLDFSGSTSSQSFVLKDSADSSKQLSFRLTSLPSNANVQLFVPFTANSTIAVLPRVMINTSNDNSTVAISANSPGSQSDEIIKFKPSAPLTANKSIFVSPANALNGQSIELIFSDMTPTLFNGFSYIISGVVGDNIVVNTNTNIRLVKFSTGWEKV